MNNKQVILSNKKAYKKLKKGVDLLVNTVSTTLGPKGSNVILHNNEGSAYVTKDGISVAKKVFSTDPYEEASIQIVRQASMQTAENAGDGTTTTLILVKALLDNLYGYKDFKAMQDGVREALRRTINYINYHTTDVDYDYNSLYGIAYTSANNDSYIADLIAQAFVDAGEYGMVTLDKEYSDFTTVEETKGTIIDRGYINKAYITNYKTGISNHKNPLVILVNGCLDNIKEIASYISTPVYKLRGESGVVIVAHEFSNTAKNSLFQNHYQGVVKFLPIEAEGFGVNKKDCIEDLIAITSAEKKTEKIYISTKVSEVVSTINTTTFIAEEDNTEALSNRIDYLKGLAEEAKDNTTKDYYLKKVAKLVGKLYTIHVGGATEVEAKELYDRIEDAVCAVKTALEYGCINGGGLTLLRVSERIEDDYNKELFGKDFIRGHNAVTKALKEPFKILCKNASLNYKDVITDVDPEEGIGFDFNNYQYVNMKEAHIQDPAEVTIQALNNAVSVVMTLLSTKSIIPNNILNE